MSYCFAKYNRYSKPMRITKNSAFLFFSLVLAGCQPSIDKVTSFSSILSQEGQQVTAPAKLSFPGDHLSHPDYGIEWWYLTANLIDQNADPIWLQWTLFRIKSPQPDNSWSDGQFYMGHFSLHTQLEHFAAEQFADGGVGNVAVEKDRILINSWQMTKSAIGLPEALNVNFTDPGSQIAVTVKLDLETKNQFFLHGDQGFSLKHPQTQLASYYYALPAISVTGNVTFNGFDKENNNDYQVSGNAWYDHEWSSEFLSDDFSGWTWFSIHMDSGAKLTLFTLHPSKQASYNPSWYAAYMNVDGEQQMISADKIVFEEQDWTDSSLGRIPIAWQLLITEMEINVDIKVMKKHQISDFSIPYYEGAVNISGSQSGVGFVELTR